MKQITKIYRNSALITAVFFIASSSFLIGYPAGVLAQTSAMPSPTPTPTSGDKRGVGLEGSSFLRKSQSEQHSREAKPELVLQTGHNNFGGTTLAFSPDGRLLATTSTQSSLVTLWETATGRQLRNLPNGKQNNTNTSPLLAFSRDTRLLATSTNDTSINLWDVTTGRKFQTLVGPQPSGSFSELLLIAFATDHRSLVAITRTNSGLGIRMWDAASWREPRTMEITSQRVSRFNVGEGAIALSADSKELAMVVNDGVTVVALFDLTRGRELQTFDLTDQVITSSAISFTTDGRLFVSALVDKQLKLKQLLPTENEYQLGPTNDDRGFIKFSHDGRFVALAQASKVQVWDVKTRRKLSALDLSRSKVSKTQLGSLVSFSEDGRNIATGGLDTQTMLWETISGKPLLRLNGRINRAHSVHFSDDGTRLFSGGQTSWDLRTGRGLRLVSGIPDEVFSAPSRDGRLVAAFARNSNAIAILDTSTGQLIQTLAPAPSVGIVRRIKFSRDGALLAAIYQPVDEQTFGVVQGAQLRTRGKQLTLWDVKTGRERHNIALTSLTIDESFSPDATVLATVDSVGQLLLWDTASGSALSNARASSMARGLRCTSVTFSPDGLTLATGAAGEVAFWDVASGRQIASVKTQSDKSVIKLAFSLDGRVLASTSEDNTINVWEMATRRQLPALLGHTSNVNSIDFSPDSRLLASASDDGSTVLWDLATGQQLLTLISLDDGDEWMTVTPKGLFDGTPLSWNQILWRYNHDTFNVAPIEWFFNEFYHPGLLADVVAGKRPHVGDDFSKKDRRQPLVNLSLVYEQPQPIGLRKLKVKIRITDAPADKENPRGCGARDLRLFRNGSLVKVWHGDVLNGRTTATLEEEVTLVAGLNRLTAYAFNRDNVKSKDAQLSLSGADSLKRSGTTYIIAIGLNEYANAQYNLKYAVADAQSFSKELQSKLSLVSPSERVEIISLIDRFATKANILAALKRLGGDDRRPTLTQDSPDLDRLRRAEPEDKIVIYFAGHGTAQRQRFYLIPHDLGYLGQRSDLNDQALQTILAHSISDLELEEALEEIRASQLLLFIDACNSGQALEAEEKRRGPMNSKGLAQLAYEKGMYILTAAQSYQAALEVAQLGHGLLTYALVEEGLKTANADNRPKDGLLTAREWLDFATERVPELQEDKIKQSRGLGLDIAFTEGELNTVDPEKRTLQRPRAFYRRELEASPLVIIADKTNINARLSAPTEAVPNAPVATGRLSRWIDLQTATLTARHRWIQNSSRDTIANQMQDRVELKGRFKFDNKGAYSLNAGVFTGNSFVNGFNDTGIGTGRTFTNLYLKQLYLSAKPINGVEVQFGGLYFHRGASTEITTYDNDGYLVGERLIIQRPKRFFLDEISATFAYVGDVSIPNINKRWHQLKRSNYHQFLASKGIGERALISADYTFESGTDTLREAVRVKTPEFRLLDSLRFELYQRVAPNSASGFAASVEKVLINKRLMLGGGYAQIDRDYGGLNADRFNRGRRFFFNGTYKISPEFSISTFYTRAFQNDFPIANRTRFELIFSYDLLKTLQQVGLF